MLPILNLVVFARKMLIKTKKLLNAHHVNNGYILNAMGHPLMITIES